MNWLFKSKYVRRLEDDNARLLGENRALLNSLLGHAGYAPVDFPKEPPKPISMPRKMTWFQRQRMTERESEERILKRAKEANVRREEKSAS